MVAFEGGDPVGVLFGAKRSEETLLYSIRVHPRHRRRGHARHLLTSLSSKLAILGPPTLVAEVPAGRAAAIALFDACGWRCQKKLSQWRKGGSSASVASLGADLPVAPLGVEEAIASGLLPRASCWERDLPTLRRLEQGMEGLGFYSAERLEALLLFRSELRSGMRELLGLGFETGELGLLGLRTLLAEVERLAPGAPLVVERAAPDEIDPELFAALGFTPGPEHLRMVTEAQSA